MAINLFPHTINYDSENDLFKLRSRSKLGYIIRGTPPLSPRQSAENKVPFLFVPKTKTMPFLANSLHAGL